MTTLKSALLNILPAGERQALQASGVPGEKLFQTIVPAITSGNGLEGLKDVLREKQATSFKFNKSENRLYVYFGTKSAATKAFEFFSLYKSLIGNLKMHKTSDTGFRVDKATFFVRPQKIEAPKAQTFEEFAQSVKDAFAQATRGDGVSLTYKVDKTANRVYAYAASNRRKGAEYARAKNVLSQTLKYHVVNSGEYSLTLRFDFDQKQELGYNSLLKGLVDAIPVPKPTPAVTPVQADPASKLEGLVPQETLEQVRRILAGERLPKPVPKPRFVTQGNTEMKLHVSAGKELDLAAQAALLNQTGKDTAVFTYGQIGYAYFGSKTIHNPTVVLMRDYANPKGLYVIVRTAAGYHLHTHIKQV